MEIKTSSLIFHNKELLDTLSIPVTMGVYNVSIDAHISSQYVGNGFVRNVERYITETTMLQ